jgi:hypothetical protein
MYSLVVNIFAVSELIPRSLRGMNELNPNIYVLVFIDELLEVQLETYINFRSNETKNSKKNREKQFFLNEVISW